VFFLNHYSLNLHSEFYSKVLFVWFFFHKFIWPYHLTRIHEWNYYLFADKRFSWYHIWNFFSGWNELYLMQLAYDFVHNTYVWKSKIVILILKMQIHSQKYCDVLPEIKFKLVMYKDNSSLSIHITVFPKNYF
jgi:hypothetical protein